MKKLRMRSTLADNLHKGFVCICIGVTLYATSYIGMRYYRYITQEKPKQLLEAQKLLVEGSSEVLYDNAESLKT